MEYFKTIIKSHTAAAWIIIVTLSTTICLSAADKPNSLSVTLPDVGINFSKFKSRSSLNLSND